MQMYEDIFCTHCGNLLGFGSGDLNCCDFLCSCCFLVAKRKGTAKDFDFNSN